MLCSPKAVVTQRFYCLHGVMLCIFRNGHVDGATATTNSRTIVISSVIVLLVLVLIVLATVCFVAVLLWRRKTHKIKLSHSETVEVFI